MPSIADIQSALREQHLDGWLLTDFRGQNVLATRVLGFPAGTMQSRRWAYFIPVQGEPRKLVHRIESTALEHLPGERTVYLEWSQHRAGLQHVIGTAKKIAMEYSPLNANPYIAKVDAGTVELVRSFGVQVVSSGDLIQQFEATWDDGQWALHQEAARHTNAAFTIAFSFLAERLRSQTPVTERDVQRIILEHFSQYQMVTDHPPIVAVNAHSGDPHYETGDTPIHEGDFVLVDLWAKLNKPRAVYSDLTRVGYAGLQVPARHAEIFQVVARARDAAIALVKDAFTTNRPLQGWQVDRAARDVITQAGYGPFFVHRTGHSIGQETHGNGANMDDLETHDERQVLRQTCFSIEPGIYLPDEFGIRSEVNVFIDAAGSVHVTGGPPQQKVLALLADF